MASADVATAKASATLINNLIIVSSHVLPSRGVQHTRNFALSESRAVLAHLCGSISATVVLTRES